MKKLYIIIIGIVVLIFFSIVIVNSTSERYDFDKITKTFLNTYNKDKVSKISVYRGESLYYIIDFKYQNKKHIGVLNRNEKLIYEVEKDKLFNLIKDNKTIGYKYDKLIFEVKKNTKNGFTYYYYDALSGEFIKKISIDK